MITVDSFIFFSKILYYYVVSHHSMSQKGPIINIYIRCVFFKPNLTIFMYFMALLLISEDHQLPKLHIINNTKL